MMPTSSRRVASRKTALRARGRHFQRALIGTTLVVVAVTYYFALTSISELTQQGPPPVPVSLADRSREQATSMRIPVPHGGEAVGGGIAASGITGNPTNRHLPFGFRMLLERAVQMRNRCNRLNLPLARPSLDGNLTDLPDFGIIEALSNYRPPESGEAREWQCEAPPETECNEERFTVIFMGYRPDRLLKLRTQLFAMTSPEWRGLVAEVILVWNGERELTESEDGIRIAALADDPTRGFRMFFPLKEGFPNDLMNRYHPRFDVATKAILFYDDDGPFYSQAAILAGFELWKRNSNAEIGAMARRIDLSERQEAEYQSLPHDERHFVSQCRNIGDEGLYNFQSFAQFGARMALPSGSFLHRNFLCFLWHPALEEVRRFVRAHPVHPDDVTVSTIVSHVSGRAPKVYPRRINPKRVGETDMEIKRHKQERMNASQSLHGSRRKLLWADGDAREWSRKRSSAVNSLISYFGSINSGSLGWCYGTPYHDPQDDTCVPELARFGMVPWLTEEHMAKSTCP